MFKKAINRSLGNLIDFYAFKNRFFKKQTMPLILYNNLEIFSSLNEFPISQVLGLNI